MNFQRDELWRILSDKGWEIEVTDNYDFQRWSKETWQLRSIWSQVGTIAYLSFKLDPMEIRPEKEFVWAVAIYSEPPLYGVSDKIHHALESLEELLARFFANLGSLERPTMTTFNTSRRDARHPMI